MVACGYHCVVHVAEGYVEPTVLRVAAGYAQVSILG